MEIQINLDNSSSENENQNKLNQKINENDNKQPNFNNEINHTPQQAKIPNHNSTQQQNSSEDFSIEQIILQAQQHPETTNPQIQKSIQNSSDHQDIINQDRQLHETGQVNPQVPSNCSKQTTEQTGQQVEENGTIINHIPNNDQELHTTNDSHSNLHDILNPPPSNPREEVSINSGADQQVQNKNDNINSKIYGDNTSINEKSKNDNTIDNCSNNNNNNGIINNNNNNGISNNNNNNEISNNNNNNNGKNIQQDLENKEAKRSNFITSLTSKSGKITNFSKNESTDLESAELIDDFILNGKQQKKSADITKHQQIVTEGKESQVSFKKSKENVSENDNPLKMQVEIQPNRMKKSKSNKIGEESDDDFDIDEIQKLIDKNGTTDLENKKAELELLQQQKKQENKQLAEENLQQVHHQTVKNHEMQIEKSETEQKQLDIEKEQQVQPEKQIEPPEEKQQSDMQHQEMQPQKPQQEELVVQPQQQELVVQPQQQEVVVQPQQQEVVVQPQQEEVVVQPQQQQLEQQQVLQEQKQPVLDQQQQQQLQQQTVHETEQQQEPQKVQENLSKKNDEIGQENIQNREFHENNNSLSIQNHVSDNLHTEQNDQVCNQQEFTKTTENNKEIHQEQQYLQESQEQQQNQQYQQQQQIQEQNQQQQQQQQIWEHQQQQQQQQQILEQQQQQQSVVNPQLETDKKVKEAESLSQQKETHKEELQTNLQCQDNPIQIIDAHIKDQGMQIETCKETEKLEQPSIIEGHLQQQQPAEDTKMITENNVIRQESHAVNESQEQEIQPKQQIQQEVQLQDQVQQQPQSQQLQQQHLSQQQEEKLQKQVEETTNKCDQSIIVQDNVQHAQEIMQTNQDTLQNEINDQSNKLDKIITSHPENNSENYNNSVNQLAQILEKINDVAKILLKIQENSNNQIRLPQSSLYGSKLKVIQQQQVNPTTQTYFNNNSSVNQTGKTQELLQNLDDKKKIAARTTANNNEEELDEHSKQQTEHLQNPSNKSFEENQEENAHSNSFQSSIGRNYMKSKDMKEGYREEIICANTVSKATQQFKFNKLMEPKISLEQLVPLQINQESDQPEDQLKKYLSNLKEPISLIHLIQQYPTLNKQSILQIVEQFQIRDLLGIIQLYISKYARAESVRIEYFYYDEKNLEEEKEKEKQKEELAKQQKLKQQQNIQVQKFVPPSKQQQEEKENKDLNTSNFEAITGADIETKMKDMSDEELQNYQKYLNLKKQQLLDKKKKINPRDERIKKIHQWNEIKELCSTIFEKLATIQNRPISEICDDFGVQLDQ